MEEIEVLDEDFYEVFPEETVDISNNQVSLETFFSGISQTDNNVSNIPDVKISSPNELDNIPKNVDLNGFASIDTLFDNTNDAPTTDVLPENTIFSLTEEKEEENEIVLEALEEKEKRKQKIITRVQFGLIIFLVVSASLIYFFGYEFFEPYIKID